VGFQGFAETNSDLEYAQQAQRLVGRVRVLNVQLSGTRGIGSSLVTKLVQSSIDKKINPIEILQADKLSFVVPMQSVNGTLRMKATGIRYEVTNGALTVHIAYEFVKA
jgi:predicted AAA+ superfamily ATPase